MATIHQFPKKIDNTECFFSFALSENPTDNDPFIISLTTPDRQNKLSFNLVNMEIFIKKLTDLKNQHEEELAKFESDV